jgi:hypothetical protein
MVTVGKGADSPPKLKYFVGIDPGKNGGIAVVTFSGGKRGSPLRTSVDVCLPTPKTYRALLDAVNYGVAERFRRDGPGFVYLEKVGGYVPGKGGNVGSRMFVFGEEYGKVKMALVASGLGELYKAVRPQTWQAALGLSRPKGAGQISDALWKRRLKAEAERIFPNARVTLKTADALLLAYYCYVRRG